MSPKRKEPVVPMIEGVEFWDHPAVRLFRARSKLQEEGQAWSVGRYTFHPPRLPKAEQPQPTLRDIEDLLETMKGRHEEILARAERGVDEELRQIRAGARGGRPQKANPAELVTALEHHMAEHPNHSVSAALEAVAYDFGVSPKTVQRARHDSK